MKKTLRRLAACAAVFAIAFSSHLHAQTCNVFDLKLNSQSAVNDFNSSCRSIKGNITISGADITSLNPLSNIESIDGNLTIQLNPALPSLHGLEHLATVKNLLIYSNDLLTNLSGLQGLQTASGLIHVRFHKALVSLTGLDNLTSANTLYISNNDVLTNLTGLGSLTSLTDLLSVGTNKSLVSLSGIPKLTSVARIIVGDNELLTNLSGLEALETVSWQMQITLNKALTSLNGLSGLKYLSEIYITSNDVLPNLLGLESVTGVSWLVVGENKKLTSLTGLENLSSAANIIVRANTILSGLSGLSNLNTIGWIQISSNPELLSLEALGASSGSGRMGANERTSALTINGLSITNNAKLTECAIAPVCVFLASGTATISGNGTGCQNEAAIEAACASLPVELVSFKVSAENQAALLEWQTAEERNSAAFEIEHSLNGKIWQKAGEVKAKGESNEPAAYRWTHHHPASGLNYYRLKMIDADRTFAYSAIEHIALSGSGTASVYPNPVSDVLLVNQQQEVTQLKLIDLQGKTIYQTSKVPESGLSVTKMAAGAYQVLITRKGGVVQTSRIIIY